MANLDTNPNADPMTSNGVTAETPATPVPTASELGTSRDGISLAANPVLITSPRRSFVSQMYRRLLSRWRLVVLIASGIIAAVIITLLIMFPSLDLKLAGLLVKKGVVITALDKATNQPIVGATVTLGSYTARTDPSGDAPFYSVPVGSYTLTITVTNYAPLRQSFTVGLLTKIDTTTVHLAMNGSSSNGTGGSGNKSGNGSNNGNGNSSSGTNNGSSGGNGSNTGRGSGNNSGNNGNGNGNGNGSGGGGGSSSKLPYPANIELDGNNPYGTYNAAALASPNIAATDIRLDWATVETGAGIFNWTPLDNQIEAWATAGKKFNLIVRYVEESFSGSCTSHYQYLPPWELQKLSAKGLVFCSSGGAEIPDYFDSGFESDLMGYITAIQQHIGASPYKSSLEYVRIGVGAGGEGYPCLGCSTTDSDQLKAWGLHSPTDWKTWQEQMLTRFHQALPNTTLIYGLGYNDTDPQTGTPVDQEVAQYALQNGLGIGQEGLNIKPGYINEINFFAKMRSQYPSAYMQFATVFALKDTKTTQCDESCELTTDIQRAESAGVFSVEWYPNDAGNSSFQSQFAQWQAIVNTRTGYTPHAASSNKKTSKSPNILQMLFGWL